MPPKKKLRRAALVDVSQAPEESRWTRTTVRGEGVLQWPASAEPYRVGLWHVNLNYWPVGITRPDCKVHKRDGLYDSEELASFPY